MNPIQARRDALVTERARVHAELNSTVARVNAEGVAANEALERRRAAGVAVVGGLGGIDAQQAAAMRAGMSCLRTQLEQETKFYLEACSLLDAALAMLEEVQQLGAAMASEAQQARAAYAAKLQDIRDAAKVYPMATLTYQETLNRLGEE